jgi:hypothetical protein
MRNVRALIIALTALTISLAPTPAKSLPRQGGPCDSECSRATIDGVIYVSCDAGGGYWANCTAIIHCDRDEYGHRVNCEGQCEGSRCYWV